MVGLGVYRPSSDFSVSHVLVFPSNPIETRKVEVI